MAKKIEIFEGSLFMLKYIIVLDRVKDDIKKILKKEHKTIKDPTTFLNTTFNYKNKGILYRVINQKIYLYTENFRLEVAAAEEKDSLKIVKVMKTTGYEIALQYGDLLPDKVKFIDFQEAGVLLKGDSSPTVNRIIENYNQVYRDINDFERYKSKLDIQFKLNKIEELLSNDKQEESTIEFTEVSLVDGVELVTFSLNKPTYPYKIDESISGFFYLNNDSQMVSKPYTFGRVKSYNKSTSKLTLVVKSDIFKEIERSEFYEGKLWTDDTGTRSKIRNEKNALEKLYAKKSANKNLKAILDDPSHAKKLNKELINIDLTLFSPDFVRFNGNQKKSVIGALNSEDIFLIQGPPGTGKTTVITEMINYLTKKGQKVLLSAQTNLAVDNVLQKVGKEPHVEAIRIGNDERIELGNENYILENRIEEIQNNIKLSYKKKLQENKNINERLTVILSQLPAYQYIVQNGKHIITLLNDKSYKEEELNSIKQSVFRLEEEYLQLKYMNQSDLEFYSDNQLNIDQVRKALSVNSNKEELIALFRFKELINPPTKLLKTVSKVKELAKERQDYRTNYKQLKEKESCLLTKKIELESVLSQRHLSVAQLNNNKILNLPTSSNNRSKENELQKIKYSLNNIDEKEIFKKIRQTENELNTVKNNLIEVYENNRSFFNKEMNIIISEYSWRDLRPLIDFFEVYNEFLNHNIVLPPNTLQLLAEFKRFDAIGSTITKLHSLENRLEKEKDELLIREEELGNLISQLNHYSRDNQVLNYCKMKGIKLTNLSEKDISYAKKQALKLEQEKSSIQLFESTKSIQKEWAERMDIYQNSFEEYLLKSANLVSATCLGIARRTDNVFSETEFDYLIIDEAGRATVKELLVPMVRGKKIILVGDHKQISPEIENSMQKKLIEDGTSVNEIEELKESLFGRLFSQADESNKVMLNRQYRMSNDISSLVSSNFYDNQLLDGENIPFISHGMEEDIPQSAYWINTPINIKEYMETKTVGKSYLNYGEAHVTEKLLKKIDSMLEEPKSVGIISPYKAHTNLLEKNINNQVWMNLDIEVNTIDAFQGREKQIIFLNIVRNNKESNSGFLKQTSRLNVGLSRAQELMFVIGNAKFIMNFSSDPLEELRFSELNNIINELKDREAIIPAGFFAKEVTNNEGYDY